MQPASRSILRPRFGAMCLVGFVCVLGLGLLMPVMPKHAQDLGLSGAAIGVVNGLFWVPAVVIRPLIGPGLDGRGRRPYLIAGLALTIACASLYALASGVLGLLAARLAHGIGFATSSSAMATMASDEAPAGRSNEAMSYYWLAAFAGYAIGPGVGEALFSGGHVGLVFLTIAATNGLALGIAFALPPRPIAAAVPATLRGPLLHRAALRPATAMAFVSLAAASAETFVPLLLRERQLGGAISFFALFATALLVSNVGAGKLADRGARLSLIVVGTLCCAASMLLLRFGGSPLAMHTAAVLIGLGWGTVYPGVYARTVEHIGDDERGRAVCTLTSAGDLAFGISLLVAGAIVRRGGLEATFSTGAVMALVGVAVAIAIDRQRPVP